MHLTFLVIIGGLSVLAGFQMTPRARLLVDAFLVAARSCGFGRKEIAAWSNQSESQWKQQIEGLQHVSAYRLAMAPPDVLRAWLKVLAEPLDLVVMERSEVSALLLEQRANSEAIRQLLTIYGKPIKMTLENDSERRRA